jgi:predicted TIM-barrel fold metal-dependent hydrolase
MTRPHDGLRHIVQTHIAKRIESPSFHSDKAYNKAVSTRRLFLQTATTSAIAMAATKINFAVPKNACDCHTHMFGDPARFPFAAKRGYTPPPASTAEMLALHKSLGIQRVVVVTPSVYGTDNSATLASIKEYGKGARGIAVIDAKATDAELDALAKGGIRGIRLNLANAGIDDPTEGRQRFLAVAERMKARNWHIQINTTPRMIASLRPAVEASPVPVVFDHFGGAKTALGLTQPGFADLVALVKSGKAYVKVSGAYRASTKAPDYADATPFAQALIAANADRVVWGTDWPHPDGDSGRRFDQVSPPVPVDDAVVLNQLSNWAPDAATRKKILVDNPAKLYGF